MGLKKYLEITGKVREKSRKSQGISESRISRHTGDTLTPGL